MSGTGVGSVGAWLAQRQRLLRHACREPGQIDRSARRHGREQPQCPAIATGEVTLPVTAEEPGARRRGGLRTRARAVNLPALTAHRAEGAGERRCDRPHEVMDLERRPRPVDAPVFGPPPAEILTGQNRLRPAWRGPGDEGEPVLTVMLPDED